MVHADVGEVGFVLRDALTTPGEICIFAYLPSPAYLE